MEQQPETYLEAKGQESKAMLFLQGPQELIAMGGSRWRTLFRPYLAKQDARITKFSKGVLDRYMDD